MYRIVLGLTAALILLFTTSSALGQDTVVADDAPEVLEGGAMMADAEPESLGHDALAVDGDTPCSVTSLMGALSCVRQDGAPTWTIHHPALWEKEEDYVARAAGASPVGPVEVGGRTFYAVRADLMEVDIEAGRVISRRRYPASITSLEARDETTIDVVLRHRPDLRGMEEVSLTIAQAIDGPAPSQNPWFGEGKLNIRYTTRHDADWFVASEPGGAVLAARLQEAVERDPLNVFYLYQLGVALKESGEGERANKAFGEAARVGGVPWQDLIILSNNLEAIPEARPFAKEAFEAGRAAMEKAGIAPDRLTSLVSMAVTQMGSRAVVEDAVSAKDVERVHELSLRTADLYPAVEGGEFAWTDLADWFEAQGRADLATQWRARAASNGQGALSFLGRDVQGLDHLIIASGGLTLAVIVYALLIGIAAGRARRRLSPGDAAPGERPWVPKVKLRALLGLVILLAGLTVVPLVAGVNMAKVGTLASAPLAVLDDSLAAPEVERWLVGLAESPEQQELLGIARAEAAALKQGQPIASKQPTGELIYAAVHADARAAQWRRLKGGEIPHILPDKLANSESSFTTASYSILNILMFLSFLALLVFAGNALGRFAPGLGRWVLRLVPGGAPALAPVGGLLIAGVCAAILALLGFDSVLSGLARPSFGNYFGLGAIANLEVAAPSRAWAWIFLVVAIVVQAAAVMRDRDD